MLHKHPFLLKTVPPSASVFSWISQNKWHGGCFSWSQVIYRSPESKRLSSLSLKIQWGGHWHDVLMLACGREGQVWDQVSPPCDRVPGRWGAGHRPRCRRGMARSCHGLSRTSADPERRALDLHCFPGPGLPPPRGGSRSSLLPAFPVILFTLHTSPILNFRSNLSV